MKKIILIYPKGSPFVKVDIKILSKRYIVLENTGAWNVPYKIPFLFLQQCFFLLKTIRSVECIIISFGGYWALLPSLLGKLFKKKVYIILHGTDCASFKEINYGNLRKSYLKKVLGISYTYATKLLPVSQSLIYTENSYFDKNNVIKQGVEFFFPKITTPKEVIPNVFDGNQWQKNPTVKRHQNRCITVLSDGQFIRKGGELILEVAKKNPQLEFYFIGMNTVPSNYLISKNVHFMGRVSPEKLQEIYSEATYYLQLSLYEGFGCALCEAMLCGCIPIVSSVNVLPEIIGDTGYVLRERNADVLTKLFQEMNTENNAELALQARKRILEKYPIKVREDALYNLLGS